MRDVSKAVPARHIANASLSKLLAWGKRHGETYRVIAVTSRPVSEKVKQVLRIRKFHVGVL
jgi:hypothetical protein